MKNKNYKIDFEIYIVFLIVIGVTVFNAIYSSVNISKNQEVTSQIVNVDIPTIQELQNMNLLVTRSKMYATNWVYLQSNNDDKDSLRKIHAELYPVLKGNISSLMSQWEDKSNVDSMNIVFHEFGQLISWEKKVMEELKTFDDYEDATKKFTAAEIIESEILPRSSKIISQLNHVISSKKEQAGNENALMTASYQTLLWSVSGIAIIIIIVVLMAAFYMSNSMIVPLMRLKSFVVQMGKGEVPEIGLKARRGAVGQMTVAVIDLTQTMKQTANFAHEIGKGNFDVKFKPLSQNDEFGNALLQMRDSLQQAEQETKFRNWTNNGLALIGEVLRENTDDIEKLSEAIIHELVKIFEVNQGGIFLIRKNQQEQKYIQLTGSYAFDSRYKENKFIKMGEGLIGQCIQDKETIRLNNVPNHYFNMSSGLGSAQASHILIVPLRTNEHVYGAIELASFREFKEDQIRFIEKIGDAMASSIASSIANSVTRRLLEETQKQADRLAKQEEELLHTNEELSKQSNRLQASEKDLKQRNDDLRETARLMKDKNEALEIVREALSVKAKELESSSRYKSEFLANMSHELRTPLNSVLILARLLSENKNRTLSEKEIEYANVIHKSGNDLLMLINDILDLSKIEAGKFEMQFEQTSLAEIKNDIQLMFRELANDKKIDFVVESDSTISERINTDKMRLEQVIKNLLSNAFKFTRKEAGVVRFSITRAKKGTTFNNNNILQSRQIIGIAVSDNGIGISPDKQKLIFDAFKQADGSTSRKYGGTGLGLSISKELAMMLGGEIQVESTEGEGSTFTLYIPVEGNMTGENYEPQPFEPETNHHKTELPVSHKKEMAHQHHVIAELPDDRNNLFDTDKLILIIEDDHSFAKILYDFAHENNFKAVIATQGDIGLAYAAQYKPMAILLDMQLPVIDGWTVLKRLKENEALKQIPVHVMSVMDKKKLGIEMGAMTYLKKPIDKRDLDNSFKSISEAFEKQIRKVLVIEDEPMQFEVIKNLIQSKEKSAKCIHAREALEAYSLLAEIKFDCIILDLNLGNDSVTGYRFLEKIKSDEQLSNIPVIVFTGTEISNEQSDLLKKYSSSVIIKSPESFTTLMEETAAFLHQVKEQSNTPVPMPDTLSGKCVLVVDDDMRNIYAISGVLESEGLRVIVANNGKESLNKLAQHNNIDLILMDIMMPEMDGYTAMQEIRKMDKYKYLPIIALTAKAMTGDREKCINAGATDYVAKPVNVDQLLSLMKVHLYTEV